MAKSKADIKVSRVFIAKANIPFTHITPKFLERFPNTKVTKEQIMNTLTYKCVNDEVLRLLESWVVEINKEFNK